MQRQKKDLEDKFFQIEKSIEKQYPLAIAPFMGQLWAKNLDKDGCYYY